MSKIVECPYEACKYYSGMALKNYREIDTRLVEGYEDQLLLDLIEGVSVLNGWGLIAEMMKRFSRRLEKKNGSGNKG